jgi:arylsulfatase
MFAGKLRPVAALFALFTTLTAQQPQPAFRGKIGTTYRDSTPDWPAPVRPPKGAPNILWIVLDDVGYSQISAFGGPIETPNMDRLSRNGLAYSNFHVTALCSPTRAALLTGRNHHSVGLGVIAEYSTGFPGYNGRMPFEKAMVSEILQQNGYSTFAVGKWHLTPPLEMQPAGPFDRWPLGRGFEHFYGFLGGETDQWHPDLVEENKFIGHDIGGRHLTTALVDKSLEYMQNQQAITPDKPFMLYFATGATHAPLQAPKEWIDKYKGKFDQGWDKVREDVLARQKKLGIVPENVQLPPREPGVQAWDALSPAAKKSYARFMEVFAGMMAHTDYEIGRMISYLEQRNLLDNTLIVLNVGDNGASQEGLEHGMFNDAIYFNRVTPPGPEVNLKHYDQMGSEMTSPHYPIGWAMAGNTPFRRYKQDASNEGGTRDPLILHWPARIKNPGLRTQYHHAIDVAPTILEAVGIAAPEVVKGVKQAPHEGVSMVYTFDDPKAKSRHTTQYYEMFSRRAIYNNGWKASVYHAPGGGGGFGGGSSYDDEKWELYNMNEDFNEVTNLAEKYPSMVEELKKLFDAEARKYNVYPLDDTRIARISGGRPPIYGDRKQFSYYPGTVTLPRVGSVNINNRSYRITAEVDLPNPTASGVLAAFGGRFGGFTFYVDQGRPAFAYNFLAWEQYNIASSELLSSGKNTVAFDFVSDAKGPGSGGTGSLWINGRKVGEGRIEKTAPVTMDIAEGLDIGRDLGTPVSDKYRSPFPFGGQLREVKIELK